MPTKELRPPLRAAIRISARGRRSRKSKLSSLKFFLPAAVQKAIPFAVLPLLTHAVSTNSYGQMIILTTVMLLCTTVFGFGLDTVIFYVAHRGSSSNVGANIAAISRLLMIIPLTLGCIFSILAIQGLFSFLGVEAVPLSITIVASAMYVSGSVLATSIYRLRQRLTMYGVTIVGFSLVQQSTKLVLVRLIDDSVLAWSLGDLAGGLFVCLVSLPIIVHSATGSVTSWHRTRRLLARAFPLVPSRLAQWVLQMSDKALVVSMVGASAGGIYGLAAQIGNISGIFIIEVCRFMLPQLSQAGGEGPQSNRVHRALPIQFVASAILAGGVAFLGPLVIGVFFPSEYAGSASLIPILASAACIAGWFYSITDFIGVTLGRTKTLWVFTAIGGICGLGLNLWLIPYFGTLAAAICSVVSYSIMLIFAFMSARKQLKLFRATTRPTFIYCLAALALMLACTPGTSPDNYLLASLGLAGILLPGILVLFLHYRSSTRN